ncbi:MAG TPA: DUF2807 domain-containing protein [Byssovorax sp.]|jgi:hypothetical protein
MKTFETLGIIGVVATLAACHVDLGGISGSGTMKTEARTVPAFHAVDASGALEVTVTVGGAQKVEVTADDNLLTHVKTSVDSGTLRLSTEGITNPTKTIRVTVAAPAVDAVSASGATKVDVKGVKGDTFTANATGADTMTIAGEVGKATLKADGASTISAAALHAKSARLEADGASTTEGYATDEVDAAADGASTVTFAGAPKSVKKSASGASTVRAK